MKKIIFKALLLVAFLGGFSLNAVVGEGVDPVSKSKDYLKSAEKSLSEAKRQARLYDDIAMRRKEGEIEGRKVDFTQETELAQKRRDDLESKIKDYKDLQKQRKEWVDKFHKTDPSKQPDEALKASDAIRETSQKIQSTAKDIDQINKKLSENKLILEKAKRKYKKILTGLLSKPTKPEEPVKPKTKPGEIVRIVKEKGEKAYRDFMSKLRLSKKTDITERRNTVSDIATIEKKRFGKENEIMTWQKREANREQFLKIASEKEQQSDYYKKLKKLNELEANIVQSAIKDYKNRTEKRIDDFAQNFITIEKKLVNVSTPEGREQARQDYEKALPQVKSFYDDFKKLNTIDETYYAVFGEGNPYTILGVENTASFDIVEKAYQNRLKTALPEKKDSIEKAYNLLKKSRPLIDSRIDLIKKLVPEFNKVVDETLPNFNKKIEEWLEVVQEQVEHPVVPG